MCKPRMIHRMQWDIPLGQSSTNLRSVGSRWRSSYSQMVWSHRVLVVVPLKHLRRRLHCSRQLLRDVLPKNHVGVVFAVAELGAVVSKMWSADPDSSEFTRHYSACDI